jgi:hypothetical protein
MRTLLAISFLLASCLVKGATKTWTGATNSNWSTGSNWGGTAPASGDIANIPGGLTNYPIINSTVNIATVNINSSGSGASITVTTGGTFNISGLLTVNANGNFTVNGGIVSVSGITTDGAVVVSGGTITSDVNIILNSGGTLVQSGGLIHLASSTGTDPTDHLLIASGATVTQSDGTFYIKDFIASAGTFNQTGANALFKLFHDWKPGAGSVFNSTEGTVQFTGSGGGGPDFAAGTRQFTHIIVDAGVDPKFSNEVASTIPVSGNFTNNNTTLDNSTNATFTFNGTGSQAISSAVTGTSNTTFGHLVINKSGGTVTLLTNANVAGNLTITSGIYHLSTFTSNRASAGGTLTVSAGATLQLEANTGGQTGSNFPSGFSTLSLNATSTVEYNGSNAVTQTIFATPTYGHLTLTNGTGSGTASKITTASCTINGNLSVNTGVVVTPAAANTLGGSGTLTGSGTVQVTRTAATPDFNSQYTITNKSLTSLTVDYFAAAAQTINALNYFNLTISGSRTTSSVTLASSGTIGISGTFTPSASFTSGNYVLTGSTVDFNGGSAQDIPAFTFNNLTVSNSTKTTTGVVHVNAAFTLSSVVLNTSSTNLLILKDNATASGASYTAYVNGPVRKIGNDPFTFPVGKAGTGYMSIGISAPSVNTDGFTAEYMRNPATALGPITAPGLNFISNCDYWNLDRTTGSSSVDVTLSWNGNSNCNLASYVTDLATLTIAHYDGANWDSHGRSSTTGNVSSGTVTRNAVSAFSPFALGSTGGTSNPLLVKFTSIRAAYQSGKVKVDWTNQAETTIDHYVIERSLNSRDFNRAGHQTALLNGGNIASYTWLDTSVISSTVYYRIKAVGTDGTFFYSSIVQTGPAQQADLLIYPNPVEGDQLTLQTGNTGTGKYQVQVYDINGRNILNQSFVYHGAHFSQVINLPANLHPGIYTLRVICDGQSQVKTFLTR